MENIVAWVMTSQQAAALAKLIRIQAAAYAEAVDGVVRPEEVFTAEDLETVSPLMGGAVGVEGESVHLRTSDVRTIS